MTNNVDPDKIPCMQGHTKRGQTICALIALDKTKFLQPLNL